LHQVYWVSVFAGPPAMIVVPLDGLSDRARDRVGF
jgi:hypothetical protein